MECELSESGESDSLESEQPALRLQAMMADLVRGGLYRKHWNQADLAMAAGISRKHLSCMLSGRSQGSLEVWERLLEVVDCPLLQKTVA